VRWLWEFRGRDDLARALEEYALIHDGCEVRRYGLDMAGEGYVAMGAAEMSQEERIMRQNSSIDLIMRLMKRKDLRKFVRLYYCEGLNQRHQGWRFAMQAMGWAEDGLLFDKEMDAAIRQMWAIWRSAIDRIRQRSTVNATKS
jgi:hypothetical protein